ncbi:MAG: lipopolysaccharide biosynthesis protein [Chthonomonadetes bacterium]|nr:lipopolysaccharide biosynthesis protein [Chthonomonadetes bacterium]
MRADSAVKTFARGVMWMTLGSIGARAVTLISSVILARLLLPEHFGLFSTAMVVINAIQLIPDLGLTQALIVHSDSNQRASSTSFYAILTTATLLATAVYLGAGFIAHIARQPQVAPVLQVLAVNLVVSAAASVPIALMQKAQRWRAQAMVEFAAPVASAVVMVLMAYWGYGVWSIVGGSLTRSAVLALSVWILSRWRPSGGVDWHLLRALFRYSRWIVIERISAFLLLNTDNAYLARWQGARMLGFYALPYNWISVPVGYFVLQANRVLLPVLSALSNLEQQKAVLLKALRTLSFVLSPIYFFLIFHAALFVHTLFGAKWSPSVPVLQWLACYALAYSLAGGILSSFYWATRRPQLAVYPTWAGLAVAGAGLVWSAGEWDALSVAKCFTIAMYTRGLLMLAGLRVYGVFNMSEVLQAVTRGWIPSILSALATALLTPLIPLDSTGKLLAVVIIYAILYLVICGTLWERKPLAYFGRERWQRALSGVRPMPNRPSS